MSTEDRLDKIEHYVPESCIRHDEQMKAICSYTQEIRDTVKWALRTMIGAVVVALASTSISILVTRALAGR